MNEKQTKYQNHQEAVKNAEPHYIDYDAAHYGANTAYNLEMARKRREKEFHSRNPHSNS